MAEVFFFFAAIGAVAGAVGTVACATRSTRCSSLVCHLIFLAMLFLLLRAEFVAAAQVIVYAGAVMVLYVFVVGYVGGMEAGLAGRSGPTMRVLSVLFAAVVVRRAHDRAGRHRDRRDRDRGRGLRRRRSASRARSASCS